MNKKYIHGSSATERSRLALMNDLINERCLETIALNGERRVLDVGAGTGQFTRLMSANLPADSTIVAVEHNPDQVQAALQLADGDTDTCFVDFRIGDAVHLPLDPEEIGSFDLAHARFLLEHVADPGEVVRSMVQALRPGGRIALADDDHHLLRLWPEPEGMLTAWRAYYDSYRQFGADPLVGRKLTSLLVDAGAQPVFITQVFWGGCAGSREFDAVMDNLVGVMQGARATVLAGKEISAKDYDAAIRNLGKFRKLPDAAFWYVINWAEGRKPE